MAHAMMGTHEESYVGERTACRAGFRLSFSITTEQYLETESRSEQKRKVNCRKSVAAELCYAVAKSRVLYGSEQ